MSQLPLLIAVYCVKDGLSQWAEILQKHLHHFSLIYFKCKQYNSSPNKENIDLQLVVMDSPEWQIWTADTSEKLPYLTLCASSSWKLKQTQEHLMPWLLLCAVSKPFLSQNAVLAVLTLGVRRYHHGLSNHLQIQCFQTLGEMWKGYSGAFWRYQNSTSHLEILLARPSILCIYFHM